MNIKPKTEAQMSIEERLTAIETTQVHIEHVMMDFKQDMNRSLDKIDQRFTAADEKFNSLEKKQDDRINSLEKKMETRFDLMEKRFDSLENRVWNNFVWMMSGFAGLAGLIAHAQHWI